MKNVKILNFNSSKGVTLIELIIVLTVLTLILGTTISIFISSLQNQNRLLKDQELFNQASYAVEYMSRLINEAVKDGSGSCLGAGYSGYNYVLSHVDSLSGFYQGIKFITEDSTCQEFFLNEGAIKEVKGSASPQNILSDKFEIKYLRFIINGDKTLQGSSQNDLTQPRITIVLSIKIQGSTGQQEKIIQTTVSQRDLNIQ